jgi:hypothetical protein
VDVYIPRCGTCKAFQAGVALVNKTLYFLPPIFVLILYFINLILCVVVFLLLAIFYPNRKKLGRFLPAFVKHRLLDHAFQHPEVQRLKEKGWYDIIER